MTKSILRKNFLLTSFLTLLFLLDHLGSKLQAESANVEIVKSVSGIRALLIRDHTNPIVTVAFAFRGGAALDPKGKEGLAFLTSKLIDEGAGDLKSKAFQGKLEELLIQLNFYSSRDVFSGRLKTLTKSKEIAFGLLNLALTKPRFDLEPFERISSQLLIRLKREKENPRKIAGKELFQALFPNHPYGKSTTGNPKSLKNITRSDLKHFVQNRFSIKDLVVGVVGDVDKAGLSKLLESTFAPLPKQVTRRKLSETIPRFEGRTVRISKPVSQTTILIAAKGVKRDNPMYYPTIVLNHIFGGGTFTSRLYNQVRETRGLAYSVGSYLLPLEKSSITLISVGTKNEQAGKVIEIIKNEINSLSEKGVTRKELDDAKKYLIGSFPLRFLSSETIASMLVSIQLHGLGSNFIENRNKLISEISLETINKLATNLMKEDDLLTVIVGGQPKKHLK